MACDECLGNKITGRDFRKSFVARTYISSLFKNFPCHCPTLVSGLEAIFILDVKHCYDIVSQKGERRMWVRFPVSLIKSTGELDITYLIYKL